MTAEPPRSNSTQQLKVVSSLETRLREADLRDAALVDAEYRPHQGITVEQPTQNKAGSHSEEEEQTFINKLCQFIQAQHDKLGDRLIQAFEKAADEQRTNLHHCMKGRQAYDEQNVHRFADDIQLRTQAVLRTARSKQSLESNSASTGTGQSGNSDDLAVSPTKSNITWGSSAEDIKDLSPRDISHPSSKFLAGRSQSLHSAELEECEKSEKNEWAKIMRHSMMVRNTGASPKSMRGKVTTVFKKYATMTTDLQNVEPPGKLTLLLQHIIQTNRFQTLCATMIGFNAITMGIEIDVVVKTALASPTLHADQPDWAKMLNRGFTLFFTLELLLRLAALQLAFVFGSDWRWNGFDTGIVTLSWLEEAGDIVSNISFLRILRGVRIVRVVRVIRVFRFFRDMRMMVCMIIQSLSSVFWALLLLGIIMYLFAICFMQANYGHLQDSTPSEAFTTSVNQWYGSIFHTMLSLLMAISGGADWGELEKPLREISAIYSCLFIFYIIFVVIGVLNILTGIFVERACELNGLDRDLIIQAETLRNESFLDEMKHIFEEADADKQGSISWKEFSDYCKTPATQAYLATQQLDVSDARDLFKQFEKEDASQEVCLEHFLMGCSRMRGNAKSTDVANVLVETKQISKKIKVLERQLKSLSNIFAEILPAAENKENREVLASEPPTPAQPPAALPPREASPDTGSAPWAGIQHPFESTELS